MRHYLKEYSTWMALSLLLIVSVIGCAGQTEVTPNPTSTPIPENAVIVSPTTSPTPEHIHDDFLRGDVFTDNLTGWQNELVFENYFIGYHAPEWYHVEIRAENDKGVVASPWQSFGDVTVETEVFVENPLTSPRGDFRYGLILRRSGEQYYAFAVSPQTGSWIVLKSTSTSLETLDEGEGEEIKGLQEADILRVDADGSTFTFHVNDRVVSQIDDADYATGQIGFYVQTLDSPQVHIHYDSLTVDELQASPTLTATPEPTPVATATAAPIPTVSAVATGTEAPVATVTPTPKPLEGPASLGFFRLQSSGDGQQEFVLSLDGLPPAPAGGDYDLWAFDSERGVYDFLHGMEGDAGTVLFKGAALENMLAEGNMVVISLEPVVGNDESVPDQPIYVAAFAADMIKAIDDFVGAESGTLTNALSQIDIAVIHAGNVQNAVNEDDLAEAQRHAEHVINILSGKESANFGDHNRDGQAQNPGDDVGVPVYLSRTKNLAQNLRDDGKLNGNLDAYAGQIIQASDNSIAVVDEAIAKTFKMFSIDSLGEAQPIVDDIHTLLNNLQTGRDADGNGVIDPLAGEGTLPAARSAVISLSEVSVVAKSE